MSGNHPSPDFILWGDQVAVNSGSIEPSFRLNWPGTIAGSLWEYDSALTTRSGDWFHGRPRILWFGQNDIEPPLGQSAPNAIDRWGQVAGPENVHLIPGVGHDVMPFTENFREQTTQRMLELYNLIFQTIERHRR